jgi:repressor LexA
MLTERQRQVLGFLRESEEHGQCPSYKEIADRIGFNSNSNVHRVIIALEERGFIRRIPHRARAIEVIKPAGVRIGEVNEDFERGYEAGYLKGFDEGIEFERTEGKKK